jgi:putative Mn2+ efflux pump MntP
MHLIAWGAAGFAITALTVLATVGTTAMKDARWIEPRSSYLAFLLISILGLFLVILPTYAFIPENGNVATAYWVGIFTATVVTIATTGLAKRKYIGSVALRDHQAVD